MARPPPLLDDQIRRNRRRSVLMVLYVGLILALIVGSVSYLLGVPIWVGLAFGGLGALLYVMIASSSSVAAILAAAKARPANPAVREEKLLMHRVEELAIAGGLPTPRVYVTPSRDINAFAAGRNPQEAVVAVTEGALAQLNQEELQGILAHELSHIRNYDVRLATLTIALVAIIAITVEIVFRVMIHGGLRSRGGGKEGGIAIVLLIVAAVLLYIFAPMLSRLAYFAMSRHREYLADSSGAMLSRNPEGLARALEKIWADLPDHPVGSRTVASLYIENPWKRSVKESLWSTHPPVPKRIARLRGVPVEVYLRMRQAEASGRPPAPRGAP